ncbi:hypothetical protein Lpp71_02761, partial [Lacticaseibacillus paracasei subsp. paracasei Lpp71]
LIQCRGLPIDSVCKPPYLSCLDTLIMPLIFIKAKKHPVFLVFKSYAKIAVPNSAISGRMGLATRS